MTQGEALAYLGICRNTLYRDMRDGAIGCTESAMRRGARLVNREDVERRWATWYGPRTWYTGRRRIPRMRPYRRDSAPLVSDEEFVLCRPYEYMAIESEEERIREWRALHGRGNFDTTQEERREEELRDEKRSLTTEQAAEILEISPTTVRAMALRGTLSHFVVGRGNRRKALYSREQVESVAAERALKESRRLKTPAEWNYDLRYRPTIRTTIEAPPGDRLIPVKEAAAILGVRLPRITEIVLQGRLFGWQKAPGKRGSKLWLSERQVYRYASDPERIRRRNLRLGIPVEKVENPKFIGVPTVREDFREETGLVYTDGEEPRNIERNHGEFFSTKQAARELGISRAGVDRLRKQGTLLGFRRRSRPGAGYGNPWWFYLKEDVMGLKHDPEYRRLHARNLQVRSGGVVSG